MTLLISALFDQEIAVAMDTYASGGEMHHAKCWAPESGKFIVAGTGLFDVVGPWLDAVRQMPASTTARDVIEIAPAHLARQHETLIAEQPEAALFHATGFVYYFDRDDRKTPMRESFSSRDSFSAKRNVRTGFQILPQTSLPTAWQTKGLKNTDTDLMKIAQHVATECDRDATTKMHIDGGLRVIRITPHGVKTSGIIGHIRA